MFFIVFLCLALPIYPMQRRYTLSLMCWFSTAILLWMRNFTNLFVGLVGLSYNYKRPFNCSYSPCWSQSANQFLQADWNIYPWSTVVKVYLFFVVFCHYSSRLLIFYYKLLTINRNQVINVNDLRIKWLQTSIKNEITGHSLERSTHKGILMAACW